MRDGTPQLSSSFLSGFSTLRWFLTPALLHAAWIFCVMDRGSFDATVLGLYDADTTEVPPPSPLPLPHPSSQVSRFHIAPLTPSKTAVGHTHQWGAGGGAAGAGCAGASEQPHRGVAAPAAAHVAAGRSMASARSARTARAGRVAHRTRLRGRVAGPVHALAGRLLRAGGGSGDQAERGVRLGGG